MNTRGIERLKSTLLIVALVAFGAAGCGSASSAPLNNAIFQASGGKYLYVVSGSCYAGGAAVATGPANTIAKFDLATGQFIQVVADYNAASPGDSPVSITDFDSTRFLALVENAAGRRLDLVNKDGSGVTTYLTNGTALNAVARAIVSLSDLSVLVSKSNAIEKFSSGKSRIPAAASFIATPAAPCATSTTLISSMAVHSSGKIVYTHAAASPNNLIGVIKSTGYTTGVDCLAGQAAPVTTALPTRALFHSVSGRLIISYGSATLNSNSIYSYAFNGTTGAISGATIAYSDPSIINGPSSITEDPTSGDLFVANATSSFNTVERLRYTGDVFTRAQGSPFIPSGIYTRCVADVAVMN